MRRPRSLMGYVNRVLATVIVWGAIVVFALIYWPVALTLAALWVAFAVWNRRGHCEMCRAVLSRTKYRVSIENQRMTICPMCYGQLHRQKSKIAVQEYVQNGRR